MDTKSHSKAVWPLVVGGFLLFFLFAVIGQFVFASTPPEAPADVARAEERTKAHEELLAENTRRLTTYGWFDKAKGQVQIPIDQAVEMTIEELASRSPQPAGPIVPPVPATAAPEPVVEPAPEATPASATEPAEATPTEAPEPSAADPVEQPAAAN